MILHNLYNNKSSFEKDPKFLFREFIIKLALEAYLPNWLTSNLKVLLDGISVDIKNPKKKNYYVRLVYNDGSYFASKPEGFLEHYTIQKINSKSVNEIGGFIIENDKLVKLDWSEEKQTWVRIFYVDIETSPVNDLHIGTRFPEKRALAISWWQEQTEMAKQNLCNLYANVHLPQSSRNHNTLTGREIQLIFEIEKSISEG